jgi:hypothetical protein
VALAERATPQDVGTAILHAAYLRRCVADALDRRRAHCGGDGSGSGGGGDNSGGDAGAGSQRAGTHDAGLLSEEEMERCVEESRRLARRHGRRFFADTAAAGWKTRRLLLSPLERAGYALQ